LVSRLPRVCTTARGSTLMTCDITKQILSLCLNKNMDRETGLVKPISPVTSPMAGPLMAAQQQMMIGVLLSTSMH
jgi:hypothetical protein